MFSVFKPFKSLFPKEVTKVETEALLSEGLAAGLAKSKNKAMKGAKKGAPPKKKGAAEGEDPTKEDPFLLYGFGIIAYFDLMCCLVLLFAALTVFALPSMYIFAQYEGITDATMYTKMTLGNMGYSEAKCIQSPIKTDDLALSCNNNVIGEVFAIGLIGESDSFMDRCYPDIDDVCAPYINAEALKTTIETTCVGQVSCTIPNLLASYITNTTNSTAIGCTTSLAIIYTQVSCIHPEASLT